MIVRASDEYFETWFKTQVDYFNGEGYPDTVDEMKLAVKHEFNWYRGILDERVRASHRGRSKSKIEEMEEHISIWIEKNEIEEILDAESILIAPPSSDVCVFSLI